MHKVGMCMSYEALNRLVTDIGEGHDDVVKDWKDQFVLHLEDLKTKVLNCSYIDYL